MSNEKRNASGCSDPTAYSAIHNITAEQRADRNAEEFVKVVKKLSKAYKVELIDRIRFKDNPTGRVYR